MSVFAPADRFALAHPLDGDWIERGGPLVMGVVNATPDSFSDGGRHGAPEAAIAQARLLLAGGVDVIDVGGESTRPGAAPVACAEELARVLPVIEALAGLAPLSIDTYKAEVAEAALRAGASIVNDVSGGLLDAGLLGVVARSGATVILGHLRGTPAVMNEHAHYADVVGEVRHELRERQAAARQAGIPDAHIWLDPGLGFAKRAEHTLRVLAQLDALAELGAPLVIGASRKRFLAEASGDAGLPLDQREEATAAAHAIAIWLGARVVRVHSASQVSAIRVAAALRRARTDPRS